MWYNASSDFYTKRTVWLHKAVRLIPEAVNASFAMYRSTSEG